MACKDFLSSSLPCSVGHSQAFCPSGTPPAVAHKGRLCDAQPISAPIGQEPTHHGPAGPDPGAPATVPAPGPSSLVIDGQSSAWKRGKDWNRQQRRVFQRLTSWCTEAVGRGCKLVRVDLTTARGGRADLLRRHLQELRRRVERVYQFKGLEVFAIQTTEGNGVLHMVWAWRGERSFYIPQAWLSDTWADIHGAPIVYVQKMGLSRADVRFVGRYFAVQYLADQRGALVRMSWSWWRSRVALARGWETLKRLGRERSDVATWCGRNPGLVEATWSDIISAWESILREGQAVLGDTLLIVRGRDVVEAF